MNEKFFEKVVRVMMLEFFKVFLLWFQKLEVIYDSVFFYLFLIGILVDFVFFIGKNVCLIKVLILYIICYEDCMFNLICYIDEKYMRVQWGFLFLI